MKKKGRISREGDDKAEETIVTNMVGLHGQPDRSQ